MKKRIFLLFLSIMMLCMANVPLYAAAVIPDGVIIEENLGGEDELMPMAASNCVVYAPVTLDFSQSHIADH